MRTYDELLTEAQQLSASDKARLLADISIALRRDLAQTSPKPQRQSLYGVFADLGPAPSAEDIDEARRDMWGNFPREDI
jgi:hypothetical protein